jgi:hypothetical protein
LSIINTNVDGVRVLSFDKAEANHETKDARGVTAPTTSPHSMTVCPSAPTTTRRPTMLARENRSADPRVKQGGASSSFLFHLLWQLCPVLHLHLRRNVQARAGGKGPASQAARERQVVDGKPRVMAVLPFDVDYLGTRVLRPTSLFVNRSLTFLSSWHYVLFRMEQRR